VRPLPNTTTRTAPRRDRTNPALLFFLAVCASLALAALFPPPALAQCDPGRLSGPLTPEQEERLREECMSSDPDEEPRPSDDGGTTFSQDRNAMPGGANTPDEEERERLYDEANERTDDGLATSEEMADEPPGGLAGLALDAVKETFAWMWDETVGEGLKSLKEAFAQVTFGLPNAETNAFLSPYNDVLEKVRPVVLLGILILGGLMMVRSANYNVAYATQHGIPRLFFVALCMAFFPDFMRLLSDLSTSLGTAFFPGESMGETAGELLGADRIGPLPNPLFLIVWPLMLIVGFLVLCTVVLKNVLFAILFLVAPVVFGLYPIPSLSELTEAWFRGVLACLAIPMLYALELRIGSWAIRSPEILFGPVGGVSDLFTTLAALAVLYAMWKTPFKVLDWAFYSHGGGRAFLKSLAASIVIKKVA
jgi:hypothetical protein